MSRTSTRQLRHLAWCVNEALGHEAGEDGRPCECRHGVELMLWNPDGRTRCEIVFDGSTLGAFPLGEAWYILRAMERTAQQARRVAEDHATA